MCKKKYPEMNPDMVLSPDCKAAGKLSVSIRQWDYFENGWLILMPIEIRWEAAFLLFST